MKEERKEPIQIPHIQTINDHISYLTPTEHPLSANVVIIEGDAFSGYMTWEIILRFQKFCRTSQNRQEKKFG